MTAIPKDNIIIKELELNRKRLLDLTGRNRLLNYRPSKVKTIEFVNSSFQALYTNLVENERKMAFRSYSPSIELDILAAESVEIDDSYIYVEIKKEELQPKLHKISKMAESFFEEQGYSILFVAIGFISWREQVSEDFQKSPLVLIPVELRRTSIGQPYRLKWTGDEIFSNVCILEKSKELNIEIPEYVSSGDSQSITHYMEEVKQIIEKKGWSLESKCCLDFFSFTKFVLWKDLDINSWAKGSGPQDNELIKATLDSSSENQSAALELKDYNHELDTREIYHILDADPSQIAVIEAVKGGMNLVVEGPPGTGKSQTIANIIAELMGSGKSVLFVSEKMAALEVVKRRLEIAGLGDYCLELHSRKTNKKEFIHTLTKAFMFQEYEEPKIYMGNYTKLENQRKLLNEYAKTISKQIGAKGFSIYELIGLIEHVKRHFDVVGRSYTTITLPHASEINSESWDQVIDELSNITLYAKRIQNIRSFKDNPWKDTDPVFFLRDDIDNFKQKLTKTHTSWLNLNDLLNRLESKFGVVKQNKLNMLDNSLHAASLLENMRSVGKKVFYNKLWESENTKPLSILRNLEKFNNERELIMLDPNITVPAAENRWVEYLSCISIIRNLITFIQSLIKYTNLIYDGTIGQSEDFLSACKSIIDSPFENIDCMLNPKWKDLSLPQKLVDLLAKTQSQYESTKKYFSTAFLDQDNLTVIESFDTLRNSKLRFLNLTFRKARKIIKQHLVDKNSLSSATLSEQLNSAKEYYRLKYELYKYHVDSRLLFDLHWRGLQSDVNILKSIINWQREFIRLDDLGFFSDHTYVIMCDKQKPQELLGIFDRFAELHLSSQQRISDLSRSVSHKSKEEDSYSSLLAAAVRQLKYIRIIKNDPIAKSLYGYLWNSIDTQEDDLLSFLTWRSDFLKAMDEGLLNSKAIDFLDISPHDIIPIQKDYNELKKYHAIVD
ncbi:MAG: DUF4011 domain-containing protein, partial [Candidatus Cloacimonetes bacterium]|nr:DUF4011 domain-containing protein [Candidatus Cloacimonadota bacterium]